MSRALGRLRETLHDDLLVKGSHGYELTPRAERIHRQLAVLQPRLEQLFAAAEFDARSAVEVFRLAGTDYAALIFGPPLFGRIFDASPNSSLIFTRWGAGAFDDIEHGAVDLLFAGVAPPRHLRSVHLFTEPFVCVLSADHPLSARSRLTLQEYLNCDHVVVDVLDGSQRAPSTVTSPPSAPLADPACACRTTSPPLPQWSTTFSSPPCEAAGDPLRSAAVGPRCPAAGGDRTDVVLPVLAPAAPRRSGAAMAAIDG